MATTIEVNKQSVKQLFQTGATKKFVIPEYQRPYAWQDEQIQTLFDDLTEYTENNAESTYFLGSIVAYENENGEQEIIDGQQRITSLFLLLRAFYSKLDSMAKTPESKNFKSQIESALWKIDDLTAAPNREKTLITSRVIDCEGNKIFSDILKKGTIVDIKDNYSQNYKLFIELIENYAKSEPELFYRLIHNILNKVILLPITANSQDTALTIFSTLNNRGLALSDADIFKAKIYNHISNDKKKIFIKEWQQLDSDTTEVGESIQKLFYYYMFYLRASEGDRKSTTPGIRKYYSKNNFSKLYRPAIMNDLNILVNLWRVVNNRTIIDNEAWSGNIEIRKMIDALSSYPNEFWKYPVVIYYLKYHLEDNFSENFLTFLQRLFAILLSRYILTPTINVVKHGILNLNAEIIQSAQPKFDFSDIDENELGEKIKNAHRNTVRMILKILAYQHQDELLPEKWEIEHILPQKWQPTYFSPVSDREVEKLVEHIGNKIPFEKKLNIIAGNGYFSKKKSSYEQSKVKILKELSENYDDWDLEKIRERDIRIADELIYLLKKWGLNKIDTDILDTHSVFIPLEKEDDYQKFLELFKREDTDENRQKFLNELKQ